MRRRCTVLALLVACLLACLCMMSACDIPLLDAIDGSSATSAAPHTTLLSGTSWALTQLTVDGHDQPLTPTTPITLQFQQNSDTYLGSSGCNYYNGSYVVSGDQLHLAFTSVTQKACAGLIMSQEVTYLNTMQQARNFQVGERTLTLKDGRGAAILVYTATG